MKRDADSAATAERGEVATNYIGIRTAQAELRVAQRNVEIERRGYMIAKRRAEEGAVTEVDPAQAAAALISTRADAPVLAPGF
jgi:outer membrane protein, multidrug efflux system